jgi:hypothetical protein
MAIHNKTLAVGRVKSRAPLKRSVLLILSRFIEKE